jgi:hypothetical protein
MATGTTTKEDPMPSTHAIELRDEVARIRTSWDRLDKRNRGELLDFAVRECSTISECIDATDVAAMTTSAIRNHLELEFDRHLDNLGARAGILEEWGE